MIYTNWERIFPQKNQQANPTTLMGPLNNVDLWYSRLGHINKHRLQWLYKMVYVICPFDENNLKFCSSFS